MINDLKEFEKMLKICRKAGVSEISVAGISVKFGAEPTTVSGQATTDDNAGIPTDEMTPEQLMFYAVNA